jgi:hypothetical protein
LVPRKLAIDQKGHRSEVAIQIFIAFSIGCKASFSRAMQRKGFLAVALLFTL